MFQTQPIPLASSFYVPTTCSPSPPPCEDGLGLGMVGSDHGGMAGYSFAVAASAVGNMPSTVGVGLPAGSYGGPGNTVSGDSAGFSGAAGQDAGRDADEDDDDDGAESMKRGMNPAAAAVRDPRDPNSGQEQRGGSLARQQRRRQVQQAQVQAQAQVQQEPSNLQRTRLLYDSPAPASHQHYTYRYQHRLSGSDHNHMRSYHNHNRDSGSLHQRHHQPGSTRALVPPHPHLHLHLHLHSQSRSQHFQRQLESRFLSHHHPQHYAQHTGPVAFPFPAAYTIPDPSASAASNSNNSNNNNSSSSSSSSSSVSNSFTSYAPNSVADPNPNVNAGTTTPPSSSSAHSIRARSADMAGESPTDPAFQDELTAQQRAAENYQPQLEGPVIGEKRTSDAITEEYAKADPFYIEKTVNLPQTYSHFRTVQGDGNCGWRAIGFGYFEQLVLAGDPDQLRSEVARLTSLNNYLATCGNYDLELFEDMVMETLNLLRDLAECATNREAAMALLMQRFNDLECSNAIVYHLRLLAGAWLKGNADRYAPFLEGGDVTAWAHVNIEVPDKEIDHTSIDLLTSILLKPIGFVLEIAMLDRTPGSRVNTYRIPDEANGQNPANLGPIIYLLFRPDHYDILYKNDHTGAAPAPAPAAVPPPVNIQVHRAMSFSHPEDIASATPGLQGLSGMDYSPLAMIPGFGGPPPGLSSLASPTDVSPMHDTFNAPPQTPWLPNSFSEPTLQQQQQQQQQQPPISPLAPAPPPAAPTQEHQTQAQNEAPTPPGQNVPDKQNQPVDYQLRFSSQCFHLKNSSVDPSPLQQPSFSEPSFTTTMFKNSHFNKAHYNNPEFHPEQWTPEDETGEKETGNGNNKGRLKSE